MGSAESEAAAADTYAAEPVAETAGAAEADIEPVCFFAVPGTDPSVWVRERFDNAAAEQTAAESPTGAVRTAAAAPADIADCTAAEVEPEVCTAAAED